MKVGVIGIGNIGGTIARRLAANGHEVRVANSRGRGAAVGFANEIGAVPTDVRGSVDEVDVVVLSIPFYAVTQLPRDLFATLNGNAPVIDTGNYTPVMRDSNIAEIDEGMVESVWVSKHFSRLITKAFNNIHDEDFIEFPKPKGDPARLALPVASDDAKHKKLVMDIIEELGFDPVDGGNLEESWRQQPGTPAFCCDWAREDMMRALKSAVKSEAPKRRDEFVSNYGEWLAQKPRSSEIVELQRRINAIY